MFSNSIFGNSRNYSKFNTSSDAVSRRTDFDFDFDFDFDLVGDIDLELHYISHRFLYHSHVNFHRDSHYYHDHYCYYYHFYHGFHNQHWYQYQYQYNSSRHIFSLYSWSRTRKLRRTVFIFLQLWVLPAWPLHLHGLR